MAIYFINHYETVKTTPR